MLVLSRKLGEVIEIGDDIRVMVVSIGRDTVRLGIEAPRGVSVFRSEIGDRIRLEKSQQAEAGE